jgi:tetratricopeptide (TPR) repeat protein
MKQLQQRIQQTRFIVALSLFVLCVLFAVKPVIAAEDNCQKRFEALNNTHSHLLANQHDMAPSLYEIRLLALEDELFDALQQCPGDASLFSLMGELQIVLQQPSLAVAYGNKAVQLDEASWRGHYVRGTGLCLSGDCEAGLTSLRRAIALQPGNAALQLNLCSVLVWNGMYEESLPECTAVIQTGDTTVLAQAYYLRSQAYMALGNTAPAAADMVMADAFNFDETRDVLQIVKPESIPRGLLE